jgi:HD-GYP domain-containing protein (c-di-GMP phosphodiesterase class II)
MTNDRVYRPAMPTADAQAELLRGVGTQFSEPVVAALLASLKRDDVFASHLIAVD